MLGIRTGHRGRSPVGQKIFRPYRSMGRLIRALDQALFPRRCSGCRAFFHPDRTAGNCRADGPGDAERHAGATSDFARVMAPYFCPDCRGDFIPLGEQVCAKCGGPLGLGGNCRYCSNSRSPAFESAHALGLHEGMLRLAIHQLKYNRKVRLARPLGALLWQTLLRYGAPTRFDLALPVPLHPCRLRARGFNQAFLMMRHWPRTLPARPDILTKIRNTRPQVGLTLEKRRENLENAFVLKDSHAVAGKDILLVDDVFTSGTTADECARVLRSGGARSVTILTLTRGT